MISSGPVLGFIAARGGSKGVPGKNLKRLAGRPLIAYAIEVGRESGVLDRLILSTDAPEIADVGRQYGAEVPFMRPHRLATDDAPMVAVVEHALDWLENTDGWSPESVVLLQPTSPLRRPDHVTGALRLLWETGADAVVSVVPVPEHFSPDYVMKIEQGRLVSFLPEAAHISRRQDARQAYSRDGTVYAFRREAFRRTGTMYGDDCRPFLIDPGESVNIDTVEDWAAAERALRRRNT